MLFATICIAFRRRRRCSSVHRKFATLFWFLFFITLDFPFKRRYINVMYNICGINKKPHSLPSAPSNAEKQQHCCGTGEKCMTFTNMHQKLFNALHYHRQYHHIFVLLLSFFWFDGLSSINFFNIENCMHHRKCYSLYVWFMRYTEKEKIWKIRMNWNFS